MIVTSEDGRRTRQPSQAKLEARRLYEAMIARTLEEANAPANTVAEPTPEPTPQATPANELAAAPTPGPLTREQLARRLELIRNRHRALIASGKIKGGRR